MNIFKKWFKTKEEPVSSEEEVQAALDQKGEEFFNEWDRYGEIND